jgi:glycosyltransferase involved in cell wall biosynthesis
MNTKPSASIIIPVLNGETTIGQLLSALAHQAGVTPFEIIVIDNGSTDRTMEIARSHGAIVLQQPIRGPAAARNMGLQNARADIVVCADADTIPSRRWLASLLRAFDDPKIIIASGPILGWKPTTGPERFASSRAAYSRKHTVDHWNYPYAVGMNTAVRRENAVAVGGWDTFMTSGEDVDFCHRLRERFGNKIEWVEGAVLFHQHRCSEAAFEKQARWHGAGHALFLHRHSRMHRWTFFHTAVIRSSQFTLDLSRPVIAVLRATRLMGSERAEFEHYYRLWNRHFWAGFFEKREGLSTQNNVAAHPAAASEPGVRSLNGVPSATRESVLSHSR